MSEVEASAPAAAEPLTTGAGEVIGEPAAEATPEVEGVASVAESEGVEPEFEGLGEDQLASLKELLPKYREKLKIGGEEKELSYEELLQLAQKGGGADKKFYEADQYKKEAEAKIRYYQEFIEGLKQDPFSVLQQNPDLKGVNVRQAAEEYLANQLRMELMSEDERTQLQKNEEYDKMKEELDQYRKAQEAAQARAAQEEQVSYYDNLFTTALQEAGLPKNPQIIARMASMTNALLNQGIEDVTPTELAGLIREDYEKELAQYAASLGADKLPGFLGDNTVKSLKQHFAGAVKNPEAGNVAPIGSKGSKKKEEAMTVNEWKRMREALREGRA